MTVVQFTLQEGRVSTFWCEKQQLTLETFLIDHQPRFNVYKLQTRPKIKQLPEEVTMVRDMMLQDDIKEYWGFYLIKGSTVKLSVCARHEGASFFVIRGPKAAKHCAYLGELDSQVRRHFKESPLKKVTSLLSFQEESDELSFESIEEELPLNMTREMSPKFMLKSNNM